MDMATYLNEIEFAAEHLLLALWEDRQRLVALQTEIANLTTQVEHSYGQAQFIEANAEDPEDVALAAGVRFETYFGADKTRSEKESIRTNLDQRLTARRFSVNSLAGDLLQHAKQGISTVHGSRANCPSGRVVATLPIKTIIWQGRNQAIHFEERKFSADVHQCFQTLAKEASPVFNEYMNRSMGFDVVELLGWTDVSRFRQDMVSLA